MAPKTAATSRPAPAAARLEEGVRHHQAGRLADAELCYRAVLAAEPGHPDALHLLGLAAFHRGDLPAAARQIRQALARRPGFPAAQSSLGNVLAALGEPAAAVAAHRQALAGMPGDPEVLHNLAAALAAHGELDEASTAYRAALARTPAQLVSRLALARTLCVAGHLPEAAAELLALVTAEPSHATAWTLLGTIRTDLGDLDGAGRAYAEAARLAAADFDVQTGLGVVALRRGDAVEALRQFEHAHRLRPDSVLALANLGAALRSVDRHADALPVLERAVALEPGHVLALCNLGAVHLDLGHPAEALRWFDAAVARDPRAVEPRSNRAVALSDQGDYEAAVPAAEAALRLAPDTPGALATLGRALGELGRHAEAIAACRRAIALRPDWSEAHWNLALPLLRTGQYEEGWREFEWRFTAARRRLRPVPSALPAWQGEPLAGRTLLVYWEQGFGDTIHFCRYVPLLAAAGARVLLQVQAPLRRLLAGLAGVAEFVGEDASAVRADYKVALMSLPHRFGTTLETIPATIPYLAAPTRPEALALPRTGRRRVGVAWGGSPAQTNNRFRSLPLAELAPLFALPDVDWYALQVGGPADEAAALAAAGVTDLAPRLGDFADTAAVMEELDLVVTVDTAVAHLAGALGRPTWILLSHTCCWRYLLDRSDSPWYPTARLFRQPARGAWAPVVAAARTALEESRL